MLGFDAIGRLALGQIPQGGSTTTLTASAGSFALTGVAATFRVTEAATAGAFTLTGVAVAFQTQQASSAGAYTLSGVSAAFQAQLLGAAGAYALGGNAALLQPQMLAGSANYTLTGVASFYSIDSVPGFTVLMPSKAAGPAFTKKRHRELIEEASRAREAEESARELAARKLREAQETAAAEHRANTLARRQAEDEAAALASIERMLSGAGAAFAGASSLAPAMSGADHVAAMARHAHGQAMHDDDEEAIAMLLLS